MFKKLIIFSFLIAANSAFADKIGDKFIDLLKMKSYDKGRVVEIKLICKDDTECTKKDYFGAYYLYNKKTRELLESRILPSTETADLDVFINKLIKLIKVNNPARFADTYFPVTGHSIDQSILGGIILSPATGLIDISLLPFTSLVGAGYSVKTAVYVRRLKRFLKGKHLRRPLRLGAHTENEIFESIFDY